MVRNLDDCEMLEVRKHFEFRWFADVTGQQEPVSPMAQLYNQAVFVLIPTHFGGHRLQSGAPLGGETPEVVKLSFVFVGFSGCPKRMDFQSVQNWYKATQVVGVGMGQEDRIYFSDALPSQPKEKFFPWRTPINQPYSAINMLYKHRAALADIREGKVERSVVYIVGKECGQAK